MSWLARERATLERHLPGLDEALLAISFADRERPQGGAIDAFRTSGGPGLLIPVDHLGRGATAVEAAQVQRAIGSRAPSLAIAANMHQYSIATFLSFLFRQPPTSNDWFLLDAVGSDNLLVASGFAEGKAGQGIQAPTMSARPHNGGFVLNGSKKPCSLATSMDMLTASILVPGPAGEELAVALVPADDPGVVRTPFWTNPILAGAESDEVTLTDVEVPDDLVFRSGSAAQSDLDEMQLESTVWFEVLVTASYIGVASALVEKVLESGKGTPVEHALLGTELEAAMAAVEAVARTLMDGPLDDDAFPRAMFVRYAAQSAIARSSALAVDLLGGLAFIKDPDVTYLHTAAQALALHPPSRSKTAGALAEFMATGTFATNAL
ncbi:MAG TPA: acyl-CoA dehydrogenase family protein [Thermoleophilaceae bacterium]